MGVLEVDGSFSCYSMENLSRAIPTGKYGVELTFSPHFGRVMPLLDGVVGRTDIRIHPANVPSQLEGCIAVDLSCDVSACSDSRAAFDPLLARIKNAIAQGKAVTISVEESVGNNNETSPVTAHPPSDQTPQALPSKFPPETHPGKSLFLGILQTLLSLFR